jgi:CO/xanthine dehydrogenase Mo-binding subunit
MMSDELDIAFDKTTCVMGSTDVTVDQGGSGGSDAIQTDGWPMRRVAAEARRVLLEMASTRFAVPVDQLTVSDGVIAVTGDATKKVTYGELIGGRRFNVALTGETSTRPPVLLSKERQQLKMVGQAAALRHQRSRRLVEVGGRRQRAGHGPRAQREAAGRGGEAGEHR